MTNYKERIILHCDLNNFYASVECHDNPALQGKAVAVGGSKEERHGIILAKNDIAKKCGVKTGETIWSAQKKCSDLIIVPPHFDRYSFFSKEAHKIYLEFTDLIEPFGIDECWLDVTGSTKLFGSGIEIANKIRCAIKERLGLTISVGVSFCKIFAKLGSDIKKPDAVSVVSKDNYRTVLKNLPVESLLGVGRSSITQLHAMGIFTIGDVHNTDIALLRYRLGKNGEALWKFANGDDCSEVKNINFEYQPQSVGRSTTLAADVTNFEESKRVIYSLGEEVGYELRRQNLQARGVAIGIRTNKLKRAEFSANLDRPTNSTDELVKKGLSLLKTNYDFSEPLRSLGIRATGTEEFSPCQQYTMFDDLPSEIKHEKIEKSVDKIREKLGKKSLVRAVNLGDKDSVFKKQSPSTLGKTGNAFAHDP